MGTDFAPYDGWLSALARANQYPFSFLDDRWRDVDRWREHARAKLGEVLSFEGPQVPLNPRVQRTFEFEGLLIDELTYEVGYGPRVEALFMRPAHVSEPLPGFVGLHCHGGFKWKGKEKIVKLPGQPPILDRFQEQYYGGRGWATELAKRGYAVLVHDLFQWGSRRPDERAISRDLVGDRFKGVEYGSQTYIDAFNQFMREYEHVLAKSLFAAGITWPGIMVWEDRRAVDYLVGRPEVDASRIGCCGLSGGGLRTIYLAGVEPRIACAVAVCYVHTLAGLQEADKHRSHTWMGHLPGLARHMDLCDVISLHAPAPLMVQFDEQDGLFTMPSMQEADAKIAAVYEKAGAREYYRGRFYPGPHKFDVQMQEEAFAWFDAHLTRYR